MRFESIDLIKGVAVIFMLIFHIFLIRSLNWLLCLSICGFRVRFCSMKSERLFFLIYFGRKKARDITCSFSRTIFISLDKFILLQGYSWRQIGQSCCLSVRFRNKRVSSLEFHSFRFEAFLAVRFYFSHFFFHFWKTRFLSFDTRIFTKVLAGSCWY